MFHLDIAMLFSGQGKFRPESLDYLPAIQPALQQVFHEIDSATGHRLEHTLAALTSCHVLRRSELLSRMSREEMAILVYGISVATCKHLLRHGCQPQALIGQSFGEIPAFICGRVYSVAHGAVIVQARCNVLQHAARRGGSMVVLETNAVTAQRIIFQTRATGVFVAAENSASETVIAGSLYGLRKTLDQAIRNGISTRSLNAAVALHHPGFTTDAAAAFHRHISGLSSRPASLPIFSPALGRFYEAGEDPARALAESLIRPVFLSRAFLRLRASGITNVVECGPLEGSERYVTGSAEELSFTSQGSAIGAAGPRDAHAAAAISA